MLLFMFNMMICSGANSQDISKLESGKYLKNAIPVNLEWIALPDLVAIESSKISKIN